MAILKDVTVLGPTRLIGNAVGNEITATKHITVGGTVNDVVMGDGTLLPKSSIGSVPNQGKLKLKAGSSGTEVDSGFDADSQNGAALFFSATATGAKFSINATTAEISITEIDGGTW